MFSSGNLGNILIRMRTTKGISQEELSERINISKEKLQKYENNLLMPTFEVVGAIAFICDYDILFGHKK